MFLKKLKPDSLRFKIRVLFTFILLIVLSIFSIALIFTLRHILYDDLDKDLNVKSMQIVAVLNAYVESTAYEAHPSAMLRKLVFDDDLTDINKGIITKLWQADVKSLGLHNDYFRILSSSKKTVLASERFSDFLLESFDYYTPQKGNPVKKFNNVQLNGKPFRLMNYSFFFNGTIPLMLQIATPLEKVHLVLFRVSGYVLLTLILIVLGTGVIGSIFADRVLRPVMAVIKTANNITHKDLNVRIDDSSEDDEMKALIDSFNVMINRLKLSFDHINEFSSHVAHELKTPLAIIKGEMELVLSSSPDIDEYNRVFNTVLDEVDRLIVIIKDLLLLAKLDYDVDVFNFERTDLKEFFREIYEQSSLLASPSGINVGLELPDEMIESSVDKIHLKRLFFNLMNNAIKNTPSGGEIKIHVYLRNKRLFADISDTGEGIGEKDMGKIFNKFFSVQKDTSQGNVGLGLNIAQSIARAHQGIITAKSRPGEGSTFTVELPLL